ncbi:hypothetical protein ACM66B_001513 [Microbotryomycetes sp. NB124-2]
MSNLIPSSWSQHSQANESPSSSSTGQTRARAPSTAYQDCQMCRITGTATFTAVGVYALVQAQLQAKTRIGRGAASIAGFGFLAAAAARWHYGAPKSDGRPHE